MMARSPSHSPEGRELDFAAAKAVQSIASRTAASFFTSLIAVARGDLPSSAEISPNVAPLAGLLPGSPMPFDMELPEAQQQQQQVGVTARSETTSSSSSGTNLAAARASDSAHADQQQRRQRTPTSSTTSSSNESGSREGMADSTAGNGRQAPRTQEQEDILYIQRLCQMGSAQLEAEKKKVKTQLKAFDEEFFRRHRRAPSKTEKEAIRPKYELYNDIKLLLANAVAAEQQAAREEGDAGSSASAATVESAISLEKKLLQRRLRRFESQFEAREGRKVKYHKDITSVRATYQRYKNLKRILQT